jgi:hypothetical protein
MLSRLLSTRTRFAGLALALALLATHAGAAERELRVLHHQAIQVSSRAPND